MARRRRRALAQINVVPYIDVMLVLLVIFMVAAPMMQPGVVNLPSVDRADKSLTQKPLIVEIQKDESIKLADGEEKRKLATTLDLVVAVKAKTVVEARPVVIMADQEIRYRVVMDVMNQLKRAGIAHVGLAVDPKK